MGTKILRNISLERRSTRTSSDCKRTSVCSSESRRKLSIHKPTPLDFDTFIPWVCLEWQVPDIVTVIRKSQEKFPRTERKVNSVRCKSMNKGLKPKEDDETTSKRGTSASNTIVTRSSPVLGNFIPITASYDSRGHLAEISIVLCSTHLPRRIIQAISLCMPFHSFLKKLAIRRGCLDYVTLHEIGKLLPHSNLTDVCLDDSFVPEGNYYVLLERPSNIKYLSLNRCEIGDEVCKEIALRIEFGRPAEKCLLVLDLGSNKITDLGAKYFAETLRKNRHLLHLNFSGNKISDVGLGFLLKHLKEFPLTYDEILDKKLRKFEYLHKKNEVYERCLKESTCRKNTTNLNIPLDELAVVTTASRSAKTKKQKKPVPVVKQESRIDMAERMTLEIIGEHVDPFDDDNINIRNNYYYCTGNLKLCSLNMAYNNIEFPSLLRIIEVLIYQSRFGTHVHKTGLMRIVLDGNYLPETCPELESIDIYLKKALASQIPDHRHSVLSKRRAASPSQSKSKSQILFV